MKQKALSRYLRYYLTSNPSLVEQGYLRFFYFRIQYLEKIIDSFILAYKFNDILTAHL